MRAPKTTPKALPGRTPVPTLPGELTPRTRILTRPGRLLLSLVALAAGLPASSTSASGPAVLSIARTSPDPTRLATVGYQVTFSETVTGVDTGDFRLTTSGISGASVQAVSGSGSVRQVTVKTGTGSGSLRLDVHDDDTIVNGTGVPLGGLGPGNGDFTSGEVYTVDKIKPTVALTTPSLKTSTSPIPVTASFSEPVVGFDVLDLTLTSCTAGNFVPVSGSVYTFDLTPTVVSGTLTVKVLSSKCSDPAGNGNALSNTLSILFDSLPPTVVSSVRLAPDPTNDATVKFRVTFSEWVQGVDAADFEISASGVSGAAVTGVTGSGATRAVTVRTGSGDGTLRLDVADDDTIRDVAGNPLGGYGIGNGDFNTGQAYTVDKTRPTVALTTTVSDPTSASPIPVTATFSEAVTGFVASDVTVTNATVVDFSGSAAIYTFGLQPLAAGTTTARVAAGKASDAAGNSNTASNLLSRAYEPLTVTLTSPFEGQTYAEPASIDLQATVTSPVDQVEFFEGTSSLGTDTSAPYGLTWSDVAAGAYTLTAVATDDQAGTATSSPVHVTVTEFLTGACCDGTVCSVGTESDCSCAGCRYRGDGTVCTVPPSSSCTPVPGTPALRLVQVLASGQLSRPVHLTAPPGDTTRLFVVEKVGRIRIISGGTLLATPFLDITALVNSSGNEQGLFSLAFHPRYASNRLFYVSYTAPGGGPAGHSVIQEFQRSATNPDLADPDSGRVLLTVSQPFANHNGGQLAFGPLDGYLYISFGDGGSGGDPNNAGQRLDTLLGKILRIDVDGQDPPLAYRIPADNPFVNQPPALPEIWAYGLRNPWRLSFDRVTGDLYTADVGQNCFEEVDVVSACSPGGENYGWRPLEGFSCYNGSDCDNPTCGASCPAAPSCTPFTPPMVVYPHSDGCSVTGGFVYRGCRLPGYHGTYFYADYCSGRTWSFVWSGGVATQQQEWTSSFGQVSNPTSFGEDANGEVYVVNDGGGIYRISD